MFKDLPEGQTNYNKEWEKEARKQEKWEIEWDKIYNENGIDNIVKDLKLKDFIRSLLEQQKQEMIKKIQDIIKLIRENYMSNKINDEILENGGNIEDMESAEERDNSRDEDDAVDLAIDKDKEERLCK